ncbi:phytase [Arenimonas fontis]|uniref:phytase n=1 Tax=Arenimonas fontis TaxID=2608255 RepID=UPI001FEA2DDE|nr:phytase [Arenimonas fontis]
MHTRPLSAALVLLLAACSAAPEPEPTPPPAPAAAQREPDELAETDPLLSEAGLAHATIAEAFVSAATPEDNVDSPAAWRGPDGRTWVIATAKEGKAGLIVYDGDSGERLRGVGGTGDGEGEFLRPNGIAVAGDRLLVVERDNRRVQVLALPGFETLASFGRDQLRRPYGVWVRAPGADTLDVLVTDAYMAGEDEHGDEIVPPLAELDRRVQRYRVRFGDGGATVEHLGHFGAVSAADAIRIPESLWGDEVHDRLLIAEEDIRVGTALREYTLDGQSRGRTHGLGLFRAQAEGIALWACPDGSGYWLATDQFKDRSLFHVFDRRSLEHLGAFAGETTANTDGVWLHQAGTGRFPKGVFYAVHDDMALAAFDWRDIAAALGLREDCG